MVKKQTGLGGRIFYGWIIVAISIIVLAMGSVTRMSFPLFYVAILKDFGWSRADTAIIVSAAGAISGFSSPIAGILLDRFGARKTFPIAAILISIGAIGSSRANEIWQLALFYGAIAAVGLALIGFAPVAALTSNWFVKWRATAVGLSTAGIQGAILLASLVQFLISGVGWRNTLLVLAVIVPATIIPLSQLLRNRPQDMRLFPDGVNGSREESRIVDQKSLPAEWTLTRALKNYRFWALFCVMLGSATTINILLTHQVAHMVDIGFTPEFAASLLVIFAVMNIFGRAGGLVSDALGRQITYTIGSLGIILGTLLLMLAKDTGDAWMLYIFAILFGLFVGSNAPAYAALVADLFYGKYFGSIIGFADMGFGLGAALGPWLGGYIFDTTGSYMPAFTAAIIASLFSCASLWIAASGRTKNQKSQIAPPG